MEKPQNKDQEKAGGGQRKKAAFSENKSGYRICDL